MREGLDQQDQPRPAVSAYAASVRAADVAPDGHCESLGAKTRIRLTANCDCACRAFFAGGP
jgi:hypothetical protein